MVMYLPQRGKPAYYALDEVGKEDNQSTVELKPAVLPDDGYADGGEPYTDEELDIINS